MKELSPIIAAVVAFAVTALTGTFLIPYLKKLKFGQTILDEGPKWHASKQGTPTMGGIMMVIGVIVAMIIAVLYSFIFGGALKTELNNPYTFSKLIAGLALALCMGMIGFLDDYIKIVKKRNLGLTARQKTVLQLLVSAVYLVAMLFCGFKTLWIPFIGEVSVTSGVGILFWPIALFFVYGFTNAVNLTDGIDGLAASVSMVVSCIFMVGAGLLENWGYNTLSAATAGACIGFIIWNAHPAKVFMGDTGSMFLGGMVVALSFGINKPIILLLCGIVYLCEALSVVIQVTYFKKTGKRIFKMSPLHHHFEMCGWSEEKIVLIFSGVALLGGILSLLAINFA